MGKIWEVDFTSFSGVSNTAYDNIGTQHLTSHTNIVRTSGSLPDFNFRPGVSYLKDTVTPRYYSLHGSNTSNAYLNSSYTLRSFVLWVYTVDNTSNSFLWDAPGGQEGHLWVANSTNDFTIQSGFIVRNTPPYDFRFVTHNSSLDRTPAQAPAANTWHCLVATVDRTNSLSNFYIDGQWVSSGSIVPVSGLPTTDQSIGYRSITREGSYYLASATTYDHVLTSGEVAAIYNTFLIDSSAGNDPYQTFSGTVYGLNGEPQENVDILLIHGLTRKVEEHQLTNVSGYYEMIVPYAGDYTVVANYTPSGCRAFPMIAISGGVYFP